MSLLIERPGDVYTTGQASPGPSAERERERKMIDFYVCALSPFLSFFSGERGRAIRSLSLIHI